MATENRLLTECLSGLNTPHAPSPPSMPHPRASSQPPPHNKSVQFANLPSTSPASPEQSRNRRQRESKEDTYDSYDSESSLGRDRHHRSKRSKRHQKSYHDDSRSPSPAHSDETIDLPERFDEYGRPTKSEREQEMDPLAAKIEDLLSGKGTAGKLIRSLTDGLLGGGDRDQGRDRDKEGRRRRRRYS